MRTPLSPIGQKGTRGRAENGEFFTRAHLLSLEAVRPPRKLRYSLATQPEQSLACLRTCVHKKGVINSRAAVRTTHTDCANKPSTAQNRQLGGGNRRTRDRCAQEHNNGMWFNIISMRCTNTILPLHGVCRTLYSSSTPHDNSTANNADDDDDDGHNGHWTQMKMCAMRWRDALKTPGQPPPPPLPPSSSCVHACKCYAKHI